MIKLTTETIIFNIVTDQTFHILNFICLFVKQYIYACRCKQVKPSIAKFKNKLKKYSAVQLFNASRDMKYEKICKYWSPVLSCFD